ncbi:hypothetical protein ACFLUP_01565 [Chloroflexota bacterium]
MINEKKQDEPPQLTREQAIESWKRRREQDAELRASYYDLERVLGRLDKKIKEHHSHRTVISPLHRGQEITIDKSAENIIVEKRPLIISRKRQAISFSVVTGISIDYYRKRFRIWGNRDEWRVSLDTVETNTQDTKIERSSEELYIYDVAKVISILTGTEVKEKSGKPDPLRQELVFDINHIPKNLNL